ncbi:hypothetical protein CFAM422_008056 [Trichoderma lentiforme]|uniref:Uncharacterized protein n=1 Tax=Trichoderma lentiforme TaxID=1567552 RepID=A0A9P4XCZ7_9HYPO|nr:hypothetical protein CFAM422_008056 [Trichoderma lentiforme]
MGRYGINCHMDLPRLNAKPGLGYARRLRDHDSANTTLSNHLPGIFLLGIAILLFILLLLIPILPTDQTCRPTHGPPNPPLGISRFSRCLVVPLRLAGSGSEAPELAHESQPSLHTWISKPP